MPSYIGYSPWSDAANVGRGLGASLTDLLIALPRLRQQAMESEAHRAYYQAEADRAVAQKGLYEAEVPYQRARAGTELAQAGLYGAQTEYQKARTGEIGTTERAKENLGNALRQIPTTLALGGSINPLISDAVDNMARLPHSDRAGLAESLSQLIEMSNPRYRQALGLGQHMIVPVASQGSLYNAITGQTETTMPQKLGPGVGMFSLPPEGGAPEMIAQGPDRPFASQNYGSVLGAVAGSIARGMEGDPPEKIANAVQEAIMQLRTGLGQGMPGGTNAAPVVPNQRVRRYNPTTGKLE